MSWTGQERRTNNFCEMHDRQLDDVDKLKGMVNRMSGWQKAQAFFIVLCFATVVAYAGQTSASVAEVAMSVSKIDKQVATIVASDAAFKQQTRRELETITSRLERLERRQSHVNE